MAVYLAVKTLRAINDALEKDQGASYRKNLALVLPHIGDAYRGEDEGFRTHLGASLIGSECARQLWYGFRWSFKPRFSGRILRLFNRGHLEEGRFIALLLTIGCDVYQQDSEGNQFRISHAGGHFGGSGDGVAIGIPDLEAGQPALLEFKTHNDKSFQKLAKEGVRSAKFEHFVQMQTYMRKMGLATTLYMAANKNDDDIYAEIVYLESEIADQFLDRGEQIVFLNEAPKGISNSPGWWSCKFCDFIKICHQGEQPLKNCRTCAYSHPHADGNWYCVHPVRDPAMEGNLVLEKADQLKGCDNWEAHRSFGKK